MKVFIYLLVIYRILFPDAAATLMFQRPRTISLLNPIAEEVIESKTQFTDIRIIRKTLLSDSSYTDKSPITEMSGFLPDIKIEYKGLNVYIDFIFRTVLFQKPTGEYQYLQLTEEANQKILGVLIKIFPNDEFTRIVYEGNSRRFWFDKE